MNQYSNSFMVAYVKDISKTNSFWEDLGAAVLEITESKVVIKLDPMEIHYILESTEPFSDYQFATTESGRGQGSLHYFEAADLDQLYEILEQQSPAHLTPIKENHWNAREFLFSDPDGYLFCAYQML